MSCPLRGTSATTILSTVSLETRTAQVKIFALRAQQAALYLTITFLSHRLPRALEVGIVPVKFDQFNEQPTTFFHSPQPHLP